MELIRIPCTPEERALGELSPAKVSAAIAALSEAHGAVVFDNVFPPEAIKSLRDHFDNRYKKYYREDLYDDALPVGNRRMMLTVEISGIFNDAQLYCNSLILPVLRAALGDNFIMSGYGGVISLPGAKAQHLHRDHPTLFGDFDYRTKMPCFAITAAIPLIDMNVITGTTRLCLGGQRKPNDAIGETTIIDPVVPAGSILMWDYLLPHAGTPNCSDQVRPLLYLGYSRAWFRDSANYGQQQPILLPNEEFEKMPEAARKLFEWSRGNKWLDWSKHPATEQCPCGSGKLFRDCHYGRFPRPTAGNEG
jgi:hypothetical protein